MTSTIELPPIARYQRDAIFCPERMAIIEATTKAGKAQPLDAIVYTPEGPSRMGDLEVGSMVFGVDGEPTRVTGVFPQGERPIYRLEFNDDTAVECDLDHLWEIHAAKSKTRILSVRQLLEFNPSRLKRFWIPTADPVRFEARAVPFDPYALGLLIGDGCLRHQTIGFSSVDQELVAALESSLPRGHSLRKSTGCDWNVTMGRNARAHIDSGTTLCGTLRRMGLMEKLSDEKFIPKVYLYNSLEVRWAILQGIMDTDGFVDRRGQPMLEQTSGKLARDITELVQSLGGTVYTNIRPINGYKKDGKFIQCKPVWRQLIRLPDASRCFRLPRKRDKARARKKTGHRMIRSIQFVRNAPAQCIAVEDSRHLYLTNGFVPTHNTVGCILWLIAEAFNTGEPGREYWWTAPVYGQTQIAFRRTCATLRAADPDGSIWKANQSDLFVTLDNGSTLRFKTAEKPDNLYGDDVYAAVIDEASRCREESWHAIRSTLTATRGKLRIIGNVKGKKNWAYRLARKVESGDMPGWKYAKITCKDAVKEGIIKADEVEQARKELPEHVFRELYEAEASEDGSNPFGLAHIAACLCPLSTAKAEGFGIDLAKSVDWTVVIGLDSARRVCFFDRWQGESWEMTTAKVKAIIGQTPALVDSTGVGDPIAESMIRESPNVEGFKFSSTSKQQIMEGLALAIQKHQVGFPDGVIREELECFEYEPTRTGVRYSAPEGQHDDCVCALALAVERARMFVPVTAGVVGRKTTAVIQLRESLVDCKCETCGGAYRSNDPTQRWCSVRCEMDAKRKDPNWGF